MNYLITGAGRGIGLELALFALENGNNVFTLVRDPNNARALAQAKKEHPKTLTIIKCDISDLESLADAKRQVDEILEDNPLDVLVNNAGVLLDEDEIFGDLPIEKVVESLKVNAVGAVAVTQTFLPLLKIAPDAKLICMTSKLGSILDNHSGGYYSYRMSKAALNMFAKSFSIDHPGITTILVHPGWVKTQMGGATAPTLPREAARGIYKLIQETKLDKTGSFLDTNGKEIPW